VKEMNKEDTSTEYMRQMLEAILELRDIQKEQLECTKKTLKVMS
jgi:hypothetical protein